MWVPARGGGVCDDGTGLQIKGNENWRWKHLILWQRKYKEFVAITWEMF